MTPSPIWLLAGILTPAFIGLVLMVFGKSLPRRGDWLAGLAVLAQIAGISVSWSEHIDAGFQSVMWTRGWIGTASETTSISVGLIRDTLGLSLSSLAALLIGLLLLNFDLCATEKRPQRIFSGACLSASGACLAWSSLTPWTGMIALSLVLLGAFISLGANWETEANAQFVARFARERAFGLGVALLGGMSLTSSGTPFQWTENAVWAATGANVFAAWLIATGLFLQLQPFPFLGWGVMGNDNLTAKRIVLAQAIPALAAFALLIRIEPQLRAIGVLPHFGWIALGSVFLGSLTGLLNERWQSSASTWASGTFGMAMTALSFAGPWSATAVLVSAVCASSALGFFGSILDTSEKKTVQGTLDAAAWTKMGLFAAAFAGSGFLGFSGAGGILKASIGALVLEPESRGISAASLLTLCQFMLSLLALKLAWLSIRNTGQILVSWVTALSPFLALIAGMGWLWTGTLSGAVFPDQVDLVMVSMLDTVFPNGGKLLGENEFFVGSWMIWGSFAVAFATAYGTCRGVASNGWESLAKKFPRFSGFVSTGYGIDSGTSGVIGGVIWIGSKTYEWLDRRFWQGYLPQAMGWVVRQTGSTVSWLDQQWRQRLDQGVRLGTEGPARALQFIQNGDVQWYLVFAIGFGIAVLIHFLTRGNS